MENYGKVEKLKKWKNYGKCKKLQILKNFSQQKKEGIIQYQNQFFILQSFHRKAINNRNLKN